VRVPLPMAEVWAEMQAQVEELTGQAGLQILRAILENEVARRVGPPHRPNPTASCVCWGKQLDYVKSARFPVNCHEDRLEFHGLDVLFELHRRVFRNLLDAAGRLHQSVVGESGDSLNDSVCASLM
jgi:hypothetical protein